MYYYSHHNSNKFKPLTDESGVTLIEVLIALVIMGLVAVVFLTGLETSYTTAMVNQERVTAEELAKSQLEYVKGQAYDDVNNPPQYLTVATVPQGYFVNLGAVRLDPVGDGTANDDGLQEITVTVYRGSDATGKLLLTIKGYKLNI